MHGTGSWEKEAVSFAEELEFDLALVTVPTIIVIVTLAAIVPVFSPRAVERWVRQWTEAAPATSQVISNSFGIEAAPIPRPSTALDNASSPGLPRGHLLGASPELLRTLALTIQTTDASEDSTPPYWLGTTYDEYTGHGWFSSGFTIQDYRAEEPAAEPPLPSAHISQQTVNVENFSGIVYARGTLQSVNEDFQVAWRAPGDMFGAQVSSDPYQVESIVPSFDAEALRAAGEAYPDRIRAQYLRVPENMPPRVLALARDLTAAEPTPYDRARAIETYLRTIPYSLDVPTPPGDRDVVDYFLFDLRRGTVTDYATAMAMLACAARSPRAYRGGVRGRHVRSRHTHLPCD